MAVVAVLYILFLAVGYRAITWTRLLRQMGDAGILTAAIMFIIAMASMIQFISAMSESRSRSFRNAGITDNRYILSLLIQIRLLIFGTFPKRSPR